MRRKGCLTMATRKSHRFKKIPEETKWVCISVTHYIFVSEPPTVRLYKINTFLGEIFEPRILVHLRRSVNGLPLALMCQFGFEDVLSYFFQAFSRVGRLVSLVHTYQAAYTSARDSVRLRRLARSPAYA